MMAPTLSRPGSDAGRVVRSAWVNAIGSCVLLVSVTSAAWFVSLPVHGVDTFPRYAVTILAGLYTACAMVLVLFAARGSGVNGGLTLAITEVVAVTADHITVGIGVLVAAVVMLIFVSRLDWALYAAGRWSSWPRDRSRRS